MSNSTQLRVRLEEGQREQLLAVAAARGHGETLSDMARQAIREFIDPHAKLGQGVTVLPVSSPCKQRVVELAQELQRSEAQVLEDCVEGVMDLLDGKKAPLIVLETHLRRAYHEKKESSPVRAAVDSSLEQGGSVVGDFRGPL